MATVQEIESQITTLSPEELAKFRAWYEQFDAEIWDRKIERDAAMGKLDALAGEALAEHKRGETEPLIAS